jgi:predicted metal-binding membrane protein
MGRIIMVVTVWLVMAAMMLVIALPVIAKNSGEQKQAGVQGPPALSG